MKLVFKKACLFIFLLLSSIFSINNAGSDQEKGNFIIAPDK